MTGRAVAAFLMLAVLGCGSGEQVDAATTSTVVSPSTTEPGAPDQTTFVSSTTTTTIEATLVQVRGGEVEGPDVIEVDLGATVGVWVLSDTDGEIHVHGYDLTFEMSGGTPFQVTFVADVPGVFEVEAHTGHIHLFDIRVVG